MFLKNQKAKGWPSILKGVKIGEVVNVTLKDFGAARQAISRSLPNSGVDMEFETETVERKVKGKLVKCGEIRRTA